MLLGIAAPGFAAWSPTHSHISLDGRVHAHTHAWDGAALGSSEADTTSQTEPAPSYEGGLAAAVALPIALATLVIAGTYFLASTIAGPAVRGVASAPATPPPRG